MTAASTYAARVDAVNAQRTRVRGGRPRVDPWAGLAARSYRADPHRQLDANLKVIASYVGSEDTLIDVGGGAGRLCLPLALHCRQVINVEPSPGMRAEFEALVAEAGITNARLVSADWLAAEGIQGDVAITTSVTYFVRDIVPFIEKLEAAARLRVMITLWSVPNPNQNVKLFRLVYGEEQEALPGHRELLPVLWEMGILPDVRLLPNVAVVPGSPREVRLPQTKEAAMELALQGQWLGTEDQGRARRVIEAHFHELFAPSPEGFRLLWRQDAREMLITWETGRRL